MQTIGAYEAKTHFSALLEQVEKGELIIITKHGHPIAKLIPITHHDNDKKRLAIKRLKSFNQNHTLSNLDWKMLRDKGRR